MGDDTARDRRNDRHGELDRAPFAAPEGPASVLPPRVGQILALQHSAGNAAVARLLAGSECTVVPPADPGQIGEETEQERAKRLEGLQGHDESAEHEGTPASVSMWAAGGDASMWGADAIMGPTEVNWGSMQPGSAAAMMDGAAAIPGPSSVSLSTIQNASTFNAWRLGWTSFPLATAKAPQFDFNLSSKAGGSGTEWYADPKSTQAAYEGDSVCWYLGAGTHKTTHTEGGKDVYWIISAAMSADDSTAEGEHSSDIKLAYDISLKEADDLLNAHVVGKTFGPKASEAEAKQAVLDTITSKLTHAGLGNDQSKWAATYETLYRKTLQRDSKGWHSFGLGGRATKATGEVTYDVNAGTTSVGSTASNQIVKY
jgi:hypothetical protein